MRINIIDYSDTFAENKDVAKDLRENYIYPAYLNTSEEIILNFFKIDSASQSFIHALISDLLQKQGESVLDRLVFEKCKASVKSLITTVINYSLE
jgi:hypothetical protein